MSRGLGDVYKRQVLNTNTRALALYRRMGWQVVGAKEKFDPAKDPLVVRPSQVLEMRYQG
mgnify:CR=1 FL=1